MATRLSYLRATISLLDSGQIEGRKQMAVVDAVLSLTHNIQKAFNNKEILSCLLLDVKGAFDHVSTVQLLRILRNLRVDSRIIRWVQYFMNDRRLCLAFDGQRQESQKVTTGIPQGSPISPILFLIYIRGLFPKIKASFSNSTSLSFIDDIALYVSGKNIQENCRTLEQLAEVAFS